MSYQKIRLGSGASEGCFLVNTVSSRSNETSRDQGAIHERKLSLVVISDSSRCMAWWNDHDPWPQSWHNREEAIETKRQWHTLNRRDKANAKKDLDQQCRVLQHIHEIGKPGDGTMGLSWDDKLDFTINGFTLPRNDIVCLWVNVCRLRYMPSIIKEIQFDYFLVAVEDMAAAGYNWVGLW